jgi:Skp family chaperone for outer membrane proteins
MSLIRPIVSGIVVFLVCASAAFAQMAAAKIALINTDSFYDHKAGITKLVTANKQLDAEFAVRIKALQDSGMKLQAIAKELESLQKLAPAQFNQTAFNTKRDEGERLERDLKYKKTELEDAINKRRKILLTPINTDIGSAITEFGAKNGFGAIFDVTKLGESGILLFLAESGDVTKEFITYYNARKTPVTAPK